MKKRVIFNGLMFLLICFLGYVLYRQIEEPISFQREKDRREQAVIEKLITIRKAQEAYRGITGKYANSFDDLVNTLQTGKFKLVKVTGDPDDPNFTGKITYDTTYVNAIDSVKSMNLTLEDMASVPFGEGETFEIMAARASYQQDSVEVVKVGVPYAVFMGKFKDAKFKKYDAKYDPKKEIKFGDLNKPILTGSWE